MIDKSKLADDLKGRQLSPLVQAHFRLYEFPIPHRLCGIYFLCRGTKVLYIGKSINILYRVGQHTQSDVIKFTNFYYVLCGKDELFSQERRYINHFLPPHNQDLETKRTRERRGIAEELPPAYPPPRDWSPEKRKAAADWIRAQRRIKREKECLRLRMKREERRAARNAA